MPRTVVSSMFAPAIVAALMAAPLVVLPTSRASAQISISVDITSPPPELPVYDQPPLPAPGYIWTPGFWSYGDDGYYWVPGTWVEPPEPGLLWTPGYWGWNNGRYAFNQGYWGSHVGFYGGIDYGHGYTGNGFEGGEWRGHEFAYNRSVNNFGSVHVTNVYSRTVTNVTNVRRVSFNGPNGVNARPSAEQERWNHEQHVQATAAQRQHREAASQNRDLRASVNHGNPSIKATDRPGDFSKFRSTPAPAGANHGPEQNEHRAGAPGPHMETGPHPALAPHPEAGARPDAGAREDHGPRSESAPRPEAAHKPEAAPHPEASPRPAVNPHPHAPGREGEAPRPAPAARPEAAPHADAPHAEAPHAQAPHPEAAHPEAAHPQAPAHAMAPRPAPAPHPAAAPHPAGGGKPDEKH